MLGASYFVHQVGLLKSLFILCEVVCRLGLESILPYANLRVWRMSCYLILNFVVALAHHQWVQIETAICLLSTNLHYIFLHNAVGISHFQLFLLISSCHVSQGALEAVLMCLSHSSRASMLLDVYLLLIFLHHHLLLLLLN